MKTLIHRHYVATIDNISVNNKLSIKKIITLLKSNIYKLELSIDELDKTFDPNPLIELYLNAGSALQAYDIIDKIEHKVIEAERNAQKMELNEAKKILIDYNTWRQGGEGAMPSANRLGLAIDTVIAHLTK